MRIFFSSLVIVLFIWIFNLLYSQDGRTLVNRTWDAFTTDSKGAVDVDKDYFITYTFNSDGTFTESHKTIDISKIKSNHRNLWEMVDDTLVIKLRSKVDNEIKKTVKRKLFWINSSKFYTVEKQPFDGRETYIYYHAKDTNTIE